MRSISAGLLLILMAATASFGQVARSINPANEPYHKTGGELPTLKIDTSQIRTISNQDLASEGHLFLVIFVPTCEHCTRMAKLICDHADLFQGSKVLFITKNGMKPYFADFKKETGLDQHPSFLLGIDKIYALDKLINYKELPQINVYDKHQKLVHTFNGDIPIDSLKQYLP